MLNKLITALHSLDLDPTAEELAEVLWLAFQIRRPLYTCPQIAPVEEDRMEILPKEKQFVQPPPIVPKKEVTQEEVQTKDSFPLYPRSPGEKTRSGLPFRTPAARMLPHALKLARALRPLKQWVASRMIYQLNEAATIEQIAETQIWLPVLQGIPERRFDIALVVENSGSMEIWPPVIAEFQKLLENLGAFRKVQTWELRMEEGKVHLYTQTHSTTRSRHGKELLDPTQQRLILVVSDAISVAWYNGQITKLLEYWGHHHPVAILQMLPQRLWRGTGFSEGLRVNVRATVANVANRQLSDDSADAWLTDDIPKGIKVPIVTLEADSLNDWAKLVMGKGDSWVQGVIFESSRVSSKQEVTPSPASSVAGEVTAAQRVQRFTALASPLAQQLAGYLAVAPLTLEVMRLVQQVMLPESGQIHLAEVFLGGLLKREEVSWVKYNFHDGVREILLDSKSVPEGIEVLKVVSAFIERRLGCALDFGAWLDNPAGVKVKLDEGSRPFAKVAAKVLKRLGGKYANLAQSIESQIEQAEQAEHIERNDKPEDVIPSDVNKVDFAIITALPKELEAVLDKLGTFKTLANESESLLFYLGNIGDAKIIVTHVYNMGNIDAVITATIVLERYQPTYLLIVGIAAGFKGKVKLGDVVVAESCYYDGPGKDTADGILPAPQQLHTSRFLFARSLDYQNMDWKSLIHAESAMGRFQPHVHHGVIASSERFIGNERKMASLLAAHRELRAVTMEGYGVAKVAHSRNVEFLEIRGICDFGDASKDDKWHDYAADVAAAYAVGLLHYIEDTKTREAISINLYRTGEALAGRAFQVTDFQPYETGGGGDDRMFVGRSDLLAWLLHRWRQPDSKPTVVLIGQRRIGVTNLLHKIQRARLEQVSLIPVFIDVQGISSEYDFLTTACHKMATALSLSPPPLDPQEPYVDFKQFLAQMKMPLTGRRFLLMLDEAEKIPAGRLGDRLPDFLRSLMQGHEYPTVLLFGGTQALQRMAWNYSSILFNTAQFKKVSYLSKEESQELLQKPAQDLLEFDQQVLDTAYDWTRGQPLLLQSIGAILIDQFNQTVKNGKPRSCYVNFNDFEQAVQVLVKEQNNSAFMEHWMNNDTATHRVLSTLAWCLDDTYPQIDFDGLLRKMKDARLELPQRKDVSDVVQRLVEEEILEQAELTYRFCVPLYRRWIAWRWDIRRVKEEGI